MRYAPMFWTLCLGGVLLVLGSSFSCKPPKPVYQTPPVVVENRCELPPKPVLPTPESHRPGDRKLICFTPEEANKLRQRDAVLKQWVREVLARCGPVAEETKDAGSTSAKD